MQECNDDIKGRLRCREKYSQAQLFTISQEMNSTWDWYSITREDYRKKIVIAFIIYLYCACYYFIFLFFLNFHYLTWLGSTIHSLDFVCVFYK